MSLTTLLTQRWTNPGAPAVTFGDHTLDYGGLRTRVQSAIAWLVAHDIQPGDTVALQLPKCLEFLELHLAALALGAITLPLNPAYTASEVQWILEDARARLLVDPERLRAEPIAGDPAPWPAARDLEEIGVLCYTSGTTGRPKGARIRQRNVLAMVQSLHQAWEWRADDTLIHALPLFHVHGLFVAQHGALYAGAHCVWLDRFDPKAVVDAIETHRATVFMGVPTHYHRLLKGELDPARLGTVRLFTSGSAGLPARDWEAFRGRTGHEIVERYGMTEIGIVLSNPLRGPRKPGSVGVPLPGVQARIAPDGELEIRSDSVFAGYHNRPEATAAALAEGWMRTGDLATADPDGWIRLAGRRSEVMIRGGLNVYPAEVEAALLDDGAVAEAAVFGIPDPDLGERVFAAVVLRRPGADLESIRVRLAARLAAFKVPERLHAVQALPRNAMGKVVKSTLRTEHSVYAPPMELPHASEIRRLRSTAAAGPPATRDLGTIERALTGIALGHGNEDAEALVRQLATTWPELQLASITEGSFAALSAARRDLRVLVAAADAANRRLPGLVQDQWQELAAPEWAETRATLGALFGQRAAIQSAYAPLQRMTTALTPALEVIGTHIGLAGTELEARPTQALMRLARLLEGIAPMLADAGVPAVPPNIEGESAEDARVAMDAVAAFERELRAAQTVIQGRKESIEGELAAIEAQLQELTG